MYSVAKLSEQDRRILFRNTSQKTGLNEAIVEKDFWVCLTLDYLFHRCQWKSAFTFKGGTSLSKCYNLIKRFSEDIDLILDWRILGSKPDFFMEPEDPQTICSAIPAYFRMRLFFRSFAWKSVRLVFQLTH